MQENTYPGNVKRFWRWITFAALVVLLDEWIKMATLIRLDDVIHKNSGILFNIPLPLPIVIPLTVALGAILLFLVFRQNRVPALLIVLGGAGNLYDRLVHGFTVDYLFLPGGLAFNLSDVVIVIGILWFLFSSTHAVDESAKR